jgi:LEA14-like dessication related protein
MTGTAPGPLRSVVLAAVLAAGAGIAGCTLITPRFEHPILSVVGVEVEAAQLTEQRFRVRMHVQNPNDRALPVTGLSYTLQLAGEDFGHGLSARAFTVAAHGEAEFDMTVTTNLATSIFRILPRLSDSSQPIEYRVTGTVGTELPFLRSIPFDEHGSFQIR